MEFMDLLAKRYASPFLFLDEMIAQSSFCEFVTKIIKMHNEEEKEKVQWEIWLHKVHDKGYSEYLAECRQAEERERARKNFNVEATVNNSRNILKNFSMKG